LLLNALQATPTGGQIAISHKVEKGDVVIVVEDSGPGVAAHLRPRLFEPFFTTKQRGTGLGLAIVRKRMEEAGGTARLVSSLNGEGAKFELRVPLGDQTEKGMLPSEKTRLFL
jgi:signal transduction histidine kinase